MQRQPDCKGFVECIGRLPLPDSVNRQWNRSQRARGDNPPEEDQTNSMAEVPAIRQKPARSARESLKRSCE